MHRFFVTLGIMLLFAGASFAQQTIYFPQVANGMESGTQTHWHTSIFIDNQGTSTASGTISLVNSDGTPMQALFVDENGNGAARNGQITFQLGTGQSHKYTSTATNPLQVGYGVMTTNGQVASNVIFSHYSNVGVEFLMAEAGLPGTSPMTRQAVFADSQNGFNPGLAVVNPTTSAQNITFQLVRDDGQVVMSATQTLGPRQHFAKFLSQIFPNLPAMAGRLQFFGSGPLAAVALRFDRHFDLFTTLFPYQVP
jgi:hypothetical protein